MKKLFCASLVFIFAGFFFQSVRSQEEPQRSKEMRMPKVSEFGAYTFSRDSDKSDSSGTQIPPYKIGGVVNIFFKLQPRIKETVTVVPLRFNLPIINLQITETKKSDLLDCNVEPPDYTQEISLEKIIDKKWLEAKPDRNRSVEYPFDVFLIYPSVAFAKAISPNQLKKNMLPRGVYLQTIIGAVDLTNDGQPDLLHTRFCRNDEKQSAEKCDYSAEKLFKKINGSWKLIKIISSCT